MSALPTCGLERAAELLHCHESTAAELARAGKIPGRKVGRAWVFVEADLLAYVSGQQAVSEPPPPPSKSAFPACVGPGLYLLFLGGECVYVGISTGNAFARLGEHARTKVFDRVEWHPVDAGILAAVEREMIREIRPRYNKTHNPNADA